MSEVMTEQKSAKADFVNIELVKGNDVHQLKLDLASSHPWKLFTDAVAPIIKTAEHFYHYKDDENDLCAVSRIEELREAARLASRKKAPVRLLLTPVGDVPNAEYLQILQDKDDFLEAMESDEDNLVEAPTTTEGQQEGQPASPQQLASVKKLEAGLESKAASSPKPTPVSDQPAQAAIPVVEQPVQQRPVAVPLVPVQQPVVPSPSVSPLASPLAETAITPLAKGGRLIITTEDLRVMGGVITSIQGRSITIQLDAEDVVEGQPHRASVSVSAAPTESMGKEFKQDASVQEGKRKPALPLFQQLKNALILEAQLIKKDLSETNFRMVWKEMLNELKLVYLDIARVFSRKKPAALPAPAPAGESKKDAPATTPVETKKDSPSSNFSAAESKHTPPPPPPRKSSGETKQTVPPMSYLLPAETTGDLPSPPTAINPALGLSQQQHAGSGSTKFDYQLELDLLVDMGYKDLNGLRELLTAAKGSVPLVITWLVSKGA